MTIYGQWLKPGSILYKTEVVEAGLDTYSLKSPESLVHNHQTLPKKPTQTQAQTRSCECHSLTFYLSLGNVMPFPVFSVAFK
jgi:hypothetical protein